MLIEVSEGEVLDRLSILEIKQSNIKDETRLVEVKKEIQTLSFINDVKEKYKLYYALLHYVNTCIWNMTDDIKALTMHHSSYAEKSFRIFEWNQQRFRMKNIINQLSTSTIKEQKSYAKLEYTYKIHDTLSIKDILCHILYLILHYDIVKIIKNTYTNDHIDYIKSYIPSVLISSDNSDHQTDLVISDSIKEELSTIINYYLV